MVLLDSPPLLPVTDAAVLAKMVGGALVVVGADRIHRPQLEESLGSLQTAGAHLLGIVMNKIDRREAGSYSYESGYSPVPQERSAPTVHARRRHSEQQIDWEPPAAQRDRVGARESVKPIASERSAVGSVPNLAN
jgi:polysaccharide biosynthesis transport protein